MGKSLQPQNATAVRQPVNTSSAASAATTPAPNEPVTAESLGWQLRAALPPLRLNSVSICDEQANVLWLSEGALGPDEHNLVMEAIEALGADTSLNCYENGLEDGRVAIFLPVRAPQGSLVGLAMILADIKSVNDNVIDRMVTPQVRTVMQKLAVLMRPAPGRAGGSASAPASAGATAPTANADASLQILEFAPDVVPRGATAETSTPASPAAAAAKKGAAASSAKGGSGAPKVVPPTLSPQAVDDILEFELTPEPPAVPTQRNLAGAPAAPVLTAVPVAAPAPAPATVGASRNGVDLSLELASEIAASAKPDTASSKKAPTAVPAVAPLISGLELPAAALQAKPTQGLPSNVTAFPTVSAAVSLGADADEFAPPIPTVSAPPAVSPPTLGAAPVSAINGKGVNGTGVHVELNGAHVNGAAGAVNGSAAHVNGAGAAVNGAAAHANGSSTITVKGLGAAVNGSASDANGSAAHVNGAGAAVDGSATHANGSSAITVNGSGAAVNGSASGVNGSAAAAANGAAVAGVNGATGTSATTTSRTLTGSTKALNPGVTNTSRVLQLPDGVNLVLDVQPFSKLRAGGRTRRFEVTARSSHPYRVPAGIDNIALQRLLTWMSSNRAAWSLEPTSFTLNLSITTLEDERFPQFVASNLKQHGIAPDNIGFEIAEPLCLQRRAQVERFITLCDKLGCFVVIDDFSLDSSIVSLLRSKALRLVKIDPKLTSVALKDKLAQAMVVAIAQAVKVLGIHCSAKRVESQASLQWLTAIGCDFAQGSALAQVQTLESLGMQPPAAPTPPAAPAPSATA
jgi:EAL domain-containing protein (putative c-di-GMP-specific phosphodiesterase class I)